MKTFVTHIPESLSGQRLDRALVTLRPELTRSRAARLAKEGHVKLDGQPAKPSAIVKAGQELVVDLPPPEKTKTAAQDLALDILFEDEEIIVINKAAGMVVHPGPGNYEGTLVNALLHYSPSLSQVGVEGRPGIVHRLDKGTSGVIVVAKTDAALVALQKQFATRQVDKEYLAIVIGKPKQLEGRIEKAIGRHVRERKKISSTTTRARPATTLWRLLAQGGGVSALACRILTGRTHQIRVHCAESGWPLVGDKTYGGVRALKRLPDPSIRVACLDLSRPALHARRLAFNHPASGERVAFATPIPDDLERILQLLEPIDDAATEK